MHLVDKIGPLLGIAAFLGLVVVAFLLFQQARDIRRLREWAGRAPERAREAAEASLAAAEARGEAPPVPPARGGRLRVLRDNLGTLRGRLAASAGRRMAELDRRLPVAPRYLLAGALVIALVAVSAAAGLGPFGGGGGGGAGKARDGASGERVAVLNGTSTPGLAADVEKRVVKPAGYRSGAVANAASSMERTTVMFAPGHSRDARALATAVEPKLGKTPTSPMTSDVRSRAEGAPLALVLGLDDANFGGGGGA